MAVRIKTTTLRFHWPAAAWLFGVFITACLGAFAYAAATRSADLDGDGRVGVLDLSILLSRYAPSVSVENNTPGDINGSGYIDISDLSILLARWGTTGVATPAPSPDVAATKRGVGGKLFVDNDPAKVSALGVDWTYNWSVAPPKTPIPGVEYVPMFCCRGSATDARIAALKAGSQSGIYKSLLGFNEPDHTKQSNMSVEEALAAWPKLESTGLRLGSPAVSHLSGPWLPEFMKGAAERGYRVDFIAVHIYQDFTNPNAVASLKNRLTQIYETYHKPIWITEIGTLDIRDWGIKMKSEPDAAKAQAYARELLPMLDSLPFVERYAWFKDACQPGASQTDNDCAWSMLYTPTGELTLMGEIYRQK